MSTLARLFNFQAGQPAVADDVDAEFNQILNAINSTATDKNLIVRYNHATEAPVTEDQLGAGLLALWRQGGVDKAKVNNDGSFETVRQFKSTLVTGTAPLVVSSNTLVANLNADLLDGLNSTQFLRNDAAGSLSASDATSLLDINQTGAGAITRFRLSGVDKVVIANSGLLTVPDLKISGANPLLTFEDTTGGQADWSWDLDAEVLTGKFVGDSAFIDFSRATSLMTIGGGIATTGGIIVGGDLDVTGEILRVLQFLVSDTTTNTSSSGDLTSFTVPAGTLPNNGNYILFHIGGTGFTQTGTLTITFNGNTIFQHTNGEAAPPTQDWSAEVKIIRLSDTSVRCLTRFHREHDNYDDSASAETNVNTVDVAAASLSGSTNIFKCVASTANITQNWLGGEYMRA